MKAPFVLRHPSCCIRHSSFIPPRHFASPTTAFHSGMKSDDTVICRTWRVAVDDPQPHLDAP